MRVLFVICAFSVFLSSVFCETIETVHTASGLTDGLFWVQKTQKLFFVDTLAHKLCSLDTLNKNVSCVRVGNGLVSFAVPVENHPDKFVVGSTNDIILVTWDSNTNVEDPFMEVLISVDKSIKGNRINYGKVDPTGRLWFGTLNDINGHYGHNLANLYSLDSNLKLQTKIQHVSFSSGLVWSLDNKKLYYDDSLTYQVASYVYNMKLETVEKREVVFDLKKNNVSGLAGRMTIDATGNLWVPIYGGGRVLKINPTTGKLLRSVRIPAARVGAACFGGPKLDILYVSTIGYGFENPKEKRPAKDQGGSIFAVKGLYVRGLPTISYKLSRV